MSWIRAKSHKNNPNNKYKNHMMIDRWNIFDYTINSPIVQNCYFTIGENINGNSRTILGVKDEKIIIESNEWLHLLNKWYFQSNNDIYYDIVEKYKFIMGKHNLTEIPDSVYSLVTSFCVGTVHGYAGLYCLLNTYLKNYIGKKVTVYRHSQKGIIDTIRAILKCIYGDNYESYIIWLDPNMTYKFNEIIFTPNEHHTYGQSEEFRRDVDNIIKSYIAPSLHTKELYEALIGHKSIDHICIFKSTNTQNVTHTSIIPFHDIEHFCTKNNVTFLEPSNYNEIDVIGILNNCTKFTTMLNNCFHKNYIYISDKCKEIDVYVITEPSLNEYNHFKNLNALLTQYKNAKINYIVRNRLE